MLQGPLKTADGSNVRPYQYALKVGTKRIHELPPCYMCSWSADSSGNYRLKFVSASCIEHNHLLRG